MHNDESIEYQGYFIVKDMIQKRAGDVGDEKSEEYTRYAITKLVDGKKTPVNYALTPEAARLKIDELIMKKSKGRPANHEVGGRAS